MDRSADIVPEDLLPRALALAVQSARPGRTRSGPSPPVWPAGTWVFGHWEADPEPRYCRTVAFSTRRDAQSTRSSINRCRQGLGERRFGAQMSAPSNGFSGAASAERTASGIKRQLYHPMVMAQLPNAQLPTCRPPMRAQKLRTIPPAERLCRLDETLHEPRYLHRVGCGGRHVDQPSTPAPHDVRRCGGRS